MSLLQAALDRLKKQRDEDYLQPWKSGKQLTDAELIWAHIQKLQNDLSLAKDEVFLHTYEDRSGGQFSRADYEQAERASQGIFG